MRPTIDGRNFDLGSQRRLGHGHRHGQVDVVASRAKNGMLLRPDNDVQIARSSAMHSGIAFAGNADALAIARASLDPNFQRFGALDRPSPWHTGQVEIFFPVPWQRGQVTLNFMRPPVCVI